MSQEEEEEKITKEMMNLLFEKTKSMFSEKVIDYGTNPRNCGTMEKPDGYAKITGPCGDTMEIFLRVKNGRIEDVRYTTDGCITSLAAGSAATVMAKGKEPRECIRINQSSILEHLGGLPDDAKHCALLAATTLHRALRNFAIGKKDDLQQK
ncbi:MAG TPA: iron-sulfur cluster assembly scaffold protein [Syntrophaceae bacterium]|jgi:nitrogen fixation NifU-like protein|nr:iron-sulfur cluster assembly scaffold protein [Syntrophaceae bacterium]